MFLGAPCQGMRGESTPADGTQREHLSLSPRERELHWPWSDLLEPSPSFLPAHNHSSSQKSARPPRSCCPGPVTRQPGAGRFLPLRHPLPGTHCKDLPRAAVPGQTRGCPSHQHDARPEGTVSMTSVVAASATRSKVHVSRARQRSPRTSVAGDLDFPKYTSVRFATRSQQFFEHLPGARPRTPGTQC